MGEPLFISALVAKRAELAGLSLDLDRQKAAIRAQISHIDHALAIFGYRDEPRDIKPKRPNVRRFKRNEVPRLGGLVRLLHGAGLMPLRLVAPSCRLFLSGSLFAVPRRD